MERTDFKNLCNLHVAQTMHPHLQLAVKSYSHSLHKWVQASNRPQASLKHSQFQRLQLPTGPKIPPELFRQHPSKTPSLKLVLFALKRQSFRVNAHFHHAMYIFSNPAWDWRCLKSCCSNSPFQYNVARPTHHGR